MTRPWAGPVAAAAIALGVLVGLTSSEADPNKANDEPEADPTEITSDAPRFATLNELVAASDLVVRGHVVSTDHGRTFGEPGSAAIGSRLVTLRVDDVLHLGDGASETLIAGSSITVEEPGWLEDGTPLIVDGVPPTSAGTDAIWFLDGVPSPALEGDERTPAYVLVGPQGHYRITGHRLIPADVDDPLITELAALGEEGLRAAVRAVVPAPVTTTAR